MAPMTAPMAKTGNQLNEICSVICDSLSPEIGLTEHTLRGSIPSSLQPEQHLSAALSYLEQQGAIIKDAKGRYLLSQEPPNSRKQEERTRQ